MSGKLPVLTGISTPTWCRMILFSTQTKPISIGVGNNRQLRSAFKVLGRPELAEDERFRTNTNRNVNRDALTGALTAAMKDWNCEELTRPAPFAADNRAVLEETGYSESEIEAMIASNSVVNECRTWQVPPLAV